MKLLKNLLLNIRLYCYLVFWSDEISTVNLAVILQSSDNLLYESLKERARNLMKKRFYKFVEDLPDRTNLTPKEFLEQQEAMSTTVDSTWRKSKWDDLDYDGFVVLEKLKESRSEGIQAPLLGEKNG